MAVLARLEALVAQLERGKTLPDYPNPQVAATAILEAVYEADWRTPGKRPVAQRLVARLERLRGAAGGLNGKAPGDARPRRARPAPPGRRAGIHPGWLARVGGPCGGPPARAATPSPSSGTASHPPTGAASRRSASSGRARPAPAQRLKPHAGRASGFMRPAVPMPPV